MFVLNVQLALRSTIRESDTANAQASFAAEREGGGRKVGFLHNLFLSLLLVVTLLICTYFEIFLNTIDLSFNKQISIMYFIITEIN